MHIQSFSAAITQRIGAEVAHYLSHLPQLKEGPIVVLLKGDLGAGKTTFVKGFLKFFRIRAYGASPTFVLMKHYKKSKASPDLYHLDAYRLSSKEDLEALEFSSVLAQKNALILIEWPEKVKGLRYPSALTVSFSYGATESERIIEIR